MLLYKFGTSRIREYSAQNQVDIINSVIRFVGNGKRNERIMRILAVNQAMYQTVDRVTKNSLWINGLYTEGDYDTLKAVRYYDIRQNCTDRAKKRAHLIPFFSYHLLKPIMDTYNTWTDGSEKCGWRFLGFLAWIASSIAILILFPGFLISKLVQILYPWVILGYLLWFGLLDQVDVFQLFMLMVFIGLQLIVFGLGIYVMKINWWIWHIYPGSNYCDWNGFKADKLMNKVGEWYEGIVWLPVIEEIVLKRFGADIGPIVIDYVKSIKLDAA